MPYKGEDFQHDRSEAYSALTYDSYGQEHDEKLGGLVNVENGVRSYWADRLKSYGVQNLSGRELEVFLLAATLLDPYDTTPVRTPGAEQFARTTLTDAPEGEKWITPNN